MDKAIKNLNYNNIIIKKEELVSLILCLIGFFLGRVFIYNQLNPIAISFLSVLLFKKYRYAIISLFVVLGMLSSFTGLVLLKYIICIIILLALNYLLKLQQETYIQAILGFVSIILAGIVVGIIDSFNLFYIVSSIFEALLAISLTFVLQEGLKIIEGKKKNKILTNEQAISLFIILGSIIAGSSGISVLDVQMPIILTNIIIMFVGYKYGASTSAVSGILIGLILMLTGFASANIIAILSITGICSGLSQNKSRILTLSFFTIARILTNYYFDSNVFDNNLIISICIADIVFILMANKINFDFYDKNKTMVDNNPSDEYIKKIRYITVSKLKNFSKSFNKLSVTFDNISEKKMSFNKNDVTKIIDEISTKVCANCPVYNTCWRNNFFNTYQSVFIILSNLEKKGDIFVEDIPDDFLTVCINLTEFISVSRLVFELQRNNLIWQNKVYESRELVAEQLLGVSEIIDNLANELDYEILFKEQLENKISLELTNAKIPFLNTIVIENKNKKLEIFLTLARDLNTEELEKKLIHLLNKVSGKKFKQEKNINSANKIKFIEEEKFKLNSAVAKDVKQNSDISGDSYSYFDLNNGEYLLALSDGMGSGFMANLESSASIDLLEEFIEAGFNKHLAIKLINSILVLKSSKDSFSTLDICTINTYDGMAEFIKLGASSTFLMRNNEVTVIKSNSLPMGILNSVDIETTTKKLDDDDIIVMVTDGILEINEYESDKEKWIVDYLPKIKSLIPSEIASSILEEAKKRSEYIIKDDMTVLCVRVWGKVL